MISTLMEEVCSTDSASAKWQVPRLTFATDTNHLRLFPTQTPEVPFPGSRPSTLATVVQVTVQTRSILAATALE